MNSHEQQHSGGEPFIEWVPAEGILFWLKISKHTLKKWRAKGIVICRRIGGIYLYNKTDLENRLNGGS